MMMIKVMMYFLHNIYRRSLGLREIWCLHNRIGDKLAWVSTNLWNQRVEMKEGQTVNCLNLKKQDWSNKKTWNKKKYLKKYRGSKKENKP